MRLLIHSLGLSTHKTCSAKTPRRVGDAVDAVGAVDQGLGAKIASKAPRSSIFALAVFYVEGIRNRCLLRSLVVFVHSVEDARSNGGPRSGLWRGICHTRVCGTGAVGSRRRSGRCRLLLCFQFNETLGFFWCVVNEDDGSTGGLGIR